MLLWTSTLERRKPDDPKSRSVVVAARHCAVIESRTWKFAVVVAAYAAVLRMTSPTAAPRPITLRMVLFPCLLPPAPGRPCSPGRTAALWQATSRGRQNELGRIARSHRAFWPRFMKIVLKYSFGLGQR